MERAANAAQSTPTLKRISGAESLSRAPTYKFRRILSRYVQLYINYTPSPAINQNPCSWMEPACDSVPTASLPTCGPVGYFSFSPLATDVLGKYQ